MGTIESAAQSCEPSVPLAVERVLSPSVRPTLIKPTAVVAPLSPSPAAASFELGSMHILEYVSVDDTVPEDEQRDHALRSLRRLGSSTNPSR